MRSGFTKKDEDEAQIAPAIVDAAEGPPPMTIESIYETMTSRFNNIDVFLCTSHEESTTMIRSLEGRLTSPEQDMGDVWGHLFSPDDYDLCSVIVLTDLCNGILDNVDFGY
ncbi:hypothetical protein V6N13_055192 [Hibiscus sabdariffa]|uniref:Uncharacterized protein n=1 Tax=Hibiscus sabdariffa TaxID=183260 RepID=A0ABR2P8B2_9ROSI